MAKRVEAHPSQSERSIGSPSVVILEAGSLPLITDEGALAMARLVKQLRHRLADWEPEEAAHDPLCRVPAD